MVLRNYELGRWLTVEEALRVLESIDTSPEFHTVDLGVAGYHNVTCDTEVDLGKAADGFVAVSRERAE